MAYKKGNEKSSANKAIKVLLLILGIVMLGSAAALYLFAFGGLEKIKNMGAGGKEAPVPFVIEGTVSAMTLEAPISARTEAEFEGYFVKAIEFAKANDFNTIVFKGKEDITAYWPDKNFPLPSSLAVKEDETAKPIDPLAILCKAAAKEEVQIWLEINPYSAVGYTPELVGNVAELAQKTGAQEKEYFEAANTAYAKFLVDSFSVLPQNYPVAALVFGSLQTPETAQPNSAEEYNIKLADAISKINGYWQANSYKTQIVLSFNEANTYLLQHTANSLAASGSVDYIMPEFSDGLNITKRMQAWGQNAKLIVALPENDKTGLALFAASQGKLQAGQLFGNYEKLTLNPQKMYLLKSTMLQVEATMPPAFEIANFLDITYPVQGEKLTWEAVYITGSSNPAEPLFIDGTEITNRASNGAFGVFVPLIMGENSFIFTNAGTTATKTITRVEPGQTVPYERLPDEFKDLPEGTAVQITSQIASAVTDYKNDGSMNETLPKGAVVMVNQSVEYQTGKTSKAAAYRLTSGDWIYARNCKVVANGKSSFTGLRAETVDGGEYIHFEGEGSPAAYIAYGEENETLTLTMYNTSFELAAGFQSELVQQAQVENGESSITLKLQVASMWGYNIEYENGKTKLFVKAKPTLSSDPLRPLEGIHVLLDPGHGEAKPGTGVTVGAPGLAGDKGYPNERHVNMALSEVIAYRLQQMGAKVTFTKKGDENPTLEERLAMQNELKPDFFISVHHDGLDGNADLTNVNGIMGYYYHPYNIPSSKLFAENLVAYNVLTTGRPNKNARWGYYYVTRTTVCPSVLFEYGFLVNPQDFDASTSTDGMYAEACATASAILASLQGTPAPVLDAVPAA